MASDLGAARLFRFFDLQGRANCICDLDSYHARTKDGMIAVESKQVPKSLAAAIFSKRSTGKILDEKFAYRKRLIC